MTKMSGILFITPNYKNYHKLQEAGLWAKYRGNINLKDNFVTEEEERKDMFKKNTKPTFSFPSLKFPQIKMLYNSGGPQSKDYKVTNTFPQKAVVTKWTS